ncbi:glycosyl transferase component of hemin storage system [Bordetella ansorpii]|uniref:Poly-beta-1,6-N-acetyl-D-glucosamine synthase n=1 Tax=Bordetella ansorpii TaxID=288768 RepID=A0A157L600_9BORD|nr:poly-beta-1,6-N-acetyl-D-glucosamine synthase [Bordetella ansorpii]SAH92248.1 glycosyl transferase component of hemin storage system [Bordetella ansorpii]
MTTQSWDLASSFVLAYVFYYPFCMAWLWITGGLAHYIQFERNQRDDIDPLTLLASHPKVSILVPCYNEDENVDEVMEALMTLNYPDYEVIAVNDGSTDATGDKLSALALRFPRLRVVHQDYNQGKAVALTTASMLAQGEYLLGIDGDSLLDENAISWMLRHFLRDGKIAAMTGNPRIRSRTTLLGRMQVGEFSSTIGLIKRTQQLYGRLFTVSGVIVMFRRHALVDVDFWSSEMLTEDIDISWKLQLAGWRIGYEPHALTWILTPETVRGLWRQRLRWAMGGVQTLVKYTGQVARWRMRRMWPIYAEYFLSVLWAYLMIGVLIAGVFGALFDMPAVWRVGLLPEWRGLLLALACMMQLLTSMVVDSKYDRGLLRYYFWTFWYPVGFWFLTMIASAIAVPAVVLRRRGKRAVWVSPDRGVRDV